MRCPFLNSVLMLLGLSLEYFISHGDRDSLFIGRSIEMPMQDQSGQARQRACPPHLTKGLALSKSRNDFMHPPQAEASGRQRSRYLRQAHFINSSIKGVSEPFWVGKVVNDTERELPRRQEDSLSIPE